MPDFLSALWLILPAYFANSGATLVKGKIRIDFSRNFFDGRPILGAGKTFEGLALGVSIGTFVGFLQSVAQNSQIFSPFFSMTAVSAFSIAFGALAGDIIGSFIKRRLALKRGEPVLLLDQLDFIAGSLLFASLFYPIGMDTVMFIIIITPIVHLAANLTGYKFGLKKEPW